ncbi:MAG TPA: 3',5'-cyclic-nucleotide phosphodiesterase [Reyranella sp.]|nr:3',5'-cyclic-nucleotide phosphodiesterase [Reyranella sp.]
MKARFLVAAAFAAGLSIAGAARAGDGFDVIALGALGGIEDGNLSAWLVHPHDDNRSVTFDAGTLVNGLRVAEEKGDLDSIKLAPESKVSRVGHVLTDLIKAYLVSHAHLDHVAGLVIASPDDSKKPIYALPSVAQALSESYFNWQAWPNFTDRGKAPQLKKYSLTELTPGVAVAVPDTKMTVTAFPLSHGGVESTAFLVESDGDAILYFGDTGPDPVEKTTKMHDVWTAVADRVRQRKLKAILIESSYTSDRPDAQLFGHLTPKWIMASLHELDALAGGNNVLKDLPVVITHIKYALTREQPQAKMREELTAANDLGVRILIPQQGSRWQFH